MRLRWLAALLLVGLMAYFGWRAYRLDAYYGESRRIRQSIWSMKDRRPPGVSAEAWEAGVGWTVTAHCNVCFSPESTSLEAMSLFGRLLDERLAGEVDAGVIEWAWDRLAETGPHGRAYTDRFRPIMREGMGQQPGHAVEK